MCERRIVEKFSPKSSLSAELYMRHYVENSRIVRPISKGHFQKGIFSVTTLISDTLIYISTSEINLLGIAMDHKLIYQTHQMYVAKRRKSRHEVEKVNTHVLKEIKQIC